MLVAMVTAPRWPARAMISASRWCCLALRTLCETRFLVSRRLRASEASTDAVPTSTGWPRRLASTISFTAYSNFSRRVLKTMSFSSTRMQGRWVGMVTTGRR